MLAISHKLLCIRLSSLLCCEPRLPRTSGEAVTQGGPLPPFALLAVLQSHLKPRIRRGFLSIHLPVSRRSSSASSSSISNPFHRGKEGRREGGREVHPVFATLPAFLHTITRGCAYAFLSNFSHSFFLHSGKSFVDLESRRKNEGIARFN